MIYCCIPNIPKLGSFRTKRIILLTSLQGLIMWFLIRVTHAFLCCPIVDETGSACWLLCSHVCRLVDASYSLGNPLGQSSWKPRHRPSMWPGLPYSMAGFHKWASQDNQTEVLITFRTYPQKSFGAMYTVVTTPPSSKCRGSKSHLLVEEWQQEHMRWL